MNHASPSYAHVTPKQFIVEETYRFKGFNGRHKSLELAPPDAIDHATYGLIEFEAIYDGHKYFGQQALDDITAGLESNLDTNQAIVGYLVLTNASHTNLQDSINTNLLTQAVPLVLPLSTDDHDLSGLIDNEATSLIQFEYRVSSDAIAVIPIQIEIALSEEEDIVEGLDSGSKDVLYGLRSEFQQEMDIRFRFDIIVPRHLKSQRATLQRAALKWPTATTPSQFSLLCVGNENPERVFLDAEKGQIYWKDIRLRRVADHPAKSEYDLYRISELSLRCKRPTDLYSVDQLVAEFEFDLPDVLLSGLSVTTFDPTGNPSKLNPVVSTRLHVLLDVHLRQIFTEKKFTPRRVLEFESLAATRERVQDIESLLRDIGFEHISSEDWSDLRDGQPTYKLTAQRMERSRQIDILIFFWGDVGETTTTINVRGGRSFTTDRVTGESRIEIVARQGTDFKELTKTLNFLQDKLKERFAHHSDVR